MEECRLCVVLWVCRVALLTILTLAASVVALPDLGWTPEVECLVAVEEAAELLQREQAEVPDLDAHVAEAHEHVFARQV